MSVQGLMAPVTVEEGGIQPTSGKRSSPQKYASNFMKVQMYGDPKSSHWQHEADRFNNNFATVEREARSKERDRKEELLKNKR